MGEINKTMKKEIPIVLERKYTNHICGEMKLGKPMRIIRRFEKDIGGYSDKIIEFEVTDRELFGKRVFRET